MAGILGYSFEVYRQHLPLILIFSLSFIIAFLIPIFASFPTYNDLGAIFIRTASTLTNLTPISSAIIVFSTLFSLLFLSFAIVSISIIVKHSRTHTKITSEVRAGLERYTGRVFGTLLLYTIIIVALVLLCYTYNVNQAFASIIALVITPFFFYAPASIVIDESGIIKAMRISVNHMILRFDYFLIWFLIALILLTVFDFIFIQVGNIVLSRYLILFFNSIFVMPFLVVLQCQAYMSRFSLLKR